MPSDEGKPANHAPLHEAEMGAEMDALLEFDVLPVAEASTIARELTTVWVQSNKGTASPSDVDVANFYKTVYYAARFPTLYDEDELDEEDDDDLFGEEDEHES